MTDNTGKNGLEEISLSASQISVLAPKTGPKEISSKGQGTLPLEIEKDAEIEGIGMGILSDGTPYLSQRGLARLCGVENAHIGTISSQWNQDLPRIRTIKGTLARMGLTASAAHIELTKGGRTYYCYPAEICIAVIEYYAIDAGPNVQPQARDNFRRLAGSKLRDLIYAQLGYDPTKKASKKFDKWHERIALNHQSAPKGYFCVFNEAHTIIYEMIMAGADVGEKIVVDISIGQHWGKFWEENCLTQSFGERARYPHRYPESHPQARSNPQDAWCYPIVALGLYREWLQDTYIEGGKFAAYLKGKVAKGELPPSIAQLALDAIAPAQITGPAA